MGYIKALAARARLVAEEGQNLVETTLIIAVISIVLVAGFNAAGVAAAVTNTADGIICELQGQTADFSATPPC